MDRRTIIAWAVVAGILILIATIVGVVQYNTPEARTRRLVRSLISKDNDTSYEAHRALVKAGEPVVPILIEALEDRVMTANVAAVLRDIGKPTVPDLLRALQHEDPAVRDGAAFTLGQIRDTRAVEPLIELLKDTEHGFTILWNDGSRNFMPVASAAARALGEIGDRRAVKPLIELLDSDAGNLAAEAESALDRLTHQYLGKDPAKWREWASQNPESLGPAIDR